MTRVKCVTALVVLQSALMAWSTDAQTTRIASLSLEQQPSITVDQPQLVQQHPNLLERAVAREALRLAREPSEIAVASDRHGVDEKRSWIKRHPSLFGSLVGFGAGFLVGYLPGDDGVFYDYTAEFNGLVIGGIGAGAGALAGWAFSR